MSTMWRRAMLYLGLGPDEEYDDYDAYDEPAPASQLERPWEPSGVSEPARPQSEDWRPPGEGIGQVRPIGGGPSDNGPHEPSEAPLGAVRPINPNPPPREEPAPSPAHGGGETVRPVPVPVTAKPHVVSPTSFDQAQEVADRYKANQPVIMNLQGANRDLSRRLIDFASGLCYGLAGNMDRVAKEVYLLTPADVEVSEEERRRLRERGLRDA